MLIEPAGLHLERTTAVLAQDGMISRQYQFCQAMEQRSAAQGKSVTSGGIDPAAVANERETHE
jgi:hypothetical protein